MAVMEEAACCIEELEQLFDLRWAADVRAIKAWQIAHPDQPKTWPDHADLGTWCLSRIEKLEAALYHVYAWYPVSVSDPAQTIKDIRDFAHKALEGKDD
jgi:hypothetical protein